MDTIVVTGSRGTLGRAVVARLHALGIPCLAVTRDSTDLAGDAGLSTGVKGAVGAVIHLAAAVPGTSAPADSEETAAITRRIDRCVYEAAAAWACPVVYASGCSLYDLKSPARMREDSPLASNIASPYLRAKADGEKLFLTLDKGIVVRIAGMIGKGLPGHVVASRFVATAMANGTIELFGSGCREQDFVDIADIAAALVAAIGAPGRSVINVATGQPITMIDFARLVVGTLGRGRYVMAGRPDSREGEYARFDATRARDWLGWSPQIPRADSIRAMAKGA